MAKVFHTLVVALLILSVNVHETSAYVELAAGAALGGAAIFFGGPLALGYLGFQAAGIAGGSMAASMMSAAATTGYGAGLVAAAQSAGAAGFAASTVAAGAGVGAAVGAATKSCRD